MTTSLGRGRALAMALALVAAAGPAGADDDEATNLRLRKVPGGVELTWTPPVLAPDSHQVRRCSLASVNDTAGRCIAEGLAAPRYVDAPPPGSWFYLVSGLYAGVEGSLGDSFDGSVLAPRTAPPCSSPPNPGPVQVLVFLEADFVTCGGDMHVRFPNGDVTFQGASCAGLLTGADWSDWGDGVDPAGLAYQVCLTSAGVGSRGPGLVAIFDFDVGDCPLGAEDFRTGRCEFTDCDTYATPQLPCSVEIL